MPIIDSDKIDEYTSQEIIENFFYLSYDVAPLLKGVLELLKEKKLLGHKDFIRMYKKATIASRQKYKGFSKSDWKKFTS